MFAFALLESDISRLFKLIGLEKDKLVSISQYRSIAINAPVLNLDD